MAVDHCAAPFGAETRQRRMDETWGLCTLVAWICSGFIM
jgi:hypothetical protein